jgi:hypothetical protein
MEHTFLVPRREDKSSRTGQRAVWPLLWRIDCAAGWLFAWSALDAANKGPLHTATVAAIAHSNPAAAALPLLMLTGPLFITNMKEPKAHRKNPL